MYICWSTTTTICKCYCYRRTKHKSNSHIQLNYDNLKPSKIDQFISVYYHSGSICRSGFLDHGDWDGRTIQYTDPWLWGMISGSGFLNCLPIEQFPEKQSGDISELKIVSHNEAFNASLRFLEKES